MVTEEVGRDYNGGMTAVTLQSQPLRLDPHKLDDDDDGDDSDDGVCDDSPSSSIKVDKVIAGLDESPPVLNNDPTQRRHLVTFVFVSCS